MEKLIVANWKSNKSFSQAQSWLQEAQELLTEKAALVNTTVVLAPPMPFVGALSEPIQTLGWQLGVQDLSPFPAGSYTGAVSGVNLNGLSVKYALIGHSERRQYFQETIQESARKAEQALEAGITPIVCVDKNTLDGQANVLAEGIAQRCVVAFEPIEAVGTGNNASLDEVKEFHQRVQRLFGSVPFLYGGSVDEQNINEYLLITDGVIVGAASLAVKQFIQLLLTARGEPLAGT